MGLIKASAVWWLAGLGIGILGAAIGPGIVAVLIALTSATLGVAVTVGFKLASSSRSWLLEAAAAFVLGLLLASPWLFGLGNQSILIVASMHATVCTVGAYFSSGRRRKL